MPPQIASAITLAFIVWLLARDRVLAKDCSRSLWLPVVWLGILGSRPITSWFGTVSANADTEGSPYDRLVYIILMVAAFVVLQQRKVNWAAFFAKNKWVFSLLAYYGISTLWADDPFVSFKRWVKEIGNVLMVLIVLTEVNPANAVKRLLFRCAVLLIPTSVLLIRYYPDLGRYYNPFIWTYSYGGVTTDKNALGMTIYVCTVGLYWGIFDLWKQRLEHRKEVGAYLILMAMCVWLFTQAHSSTALACSIICAGLLSAMRIAAFRSALQRAGLSGLLVFALIALFLSALFNPVDVVVEGLGRNMTLTGRTDIWREALKINIDPLIGTGYFSFWQSQRAVDVSTALGFFFSIKEAHDGYLEVYLNSGLIGLGLLSVLLLSSVKKIISTLAADDSYETFRLAVVVGVMFYNVTESAFSGLVLLWVMLLLVVMEYPQPLKSDTATKLELDSDENTQAA
jgi:O-antigen ligase